MSFTTVSRMRGTSHRDNNQRLFFKIQGWQVLIVHCFLQTCRRCDKIFV